MKIMQKILLIVTLFGTLFVTGCMATIEADGGSSSVEHKRDAVTPKVTTTVTETWETK